MRYETIFVKVGEQAPDVQMTLYLLDNNEEIDLHRKRPLILICAGGGYRRRSFREGEPVAVRMLAMGYHAAIIDYDVMPHVFPTQLLQTLACIAYARQHADAWQVDADNIVLMGFSAGGHVAASAGVFWPRPYYAGMLGLTPDMVRPNKLVLCYPVITSGQFAHRDSIERLTGEGYDKYLDTVSLEKQVSPEVPPSFIWHTWADELVPVENSLLFATALRRQGVPCELHLFEKGGHGLSLATEEVLAGETASRINREAAQWLQLLGAWLKAP